MRALAYHTPAQLTIPTSLAPNPMQQHQQPTQADCQPQQIQQPARPPVPVLLLLPRPEPAVGLHTPCAAPPHTYNYPTSPQREHPMRKKNANNSSTQRHRKATTQRALLHPAPTLRHQDDSAAGDKIRSAAAELSDSCAFMRYRLVLRPSLAASSCLLPAQRWHHQAPRP